MSRLLRWAARAPAPLRRAVKRLPGAGRLRAQLAGRPRDAGPAPGELRPVVYLPTWLGWDSMRQRPQYLLDAFADHGHPVWFVDPRARRAERRGGVEIVPDLRSVPGRHPILYLHFAPLRTEIARFHDPVVVYDILDDLSIYEADEAGMPAERRYAAHHPGLVRDADAVIVSSPVLADLHRAERADLLVVPNGVDPKMFGTPAPRPADLPPADPDRPLVGYHGALAEWLDYRLIEEVAALLPDWRFAFVGPVRAQAAAAAKPLGALANVTLLGERPSDAMPAYVQAFDVGAIWFTVERLTEAVSPLKLYECLAAGTPCVSTPLPVAVAEPAVRVASDAQGFVAALRAALADREDDATAAVAAAAVAGASWAHRLEPLIRHLDSAGLRRAGERRR